MINITNIESQEWIELPDGMSEIYVRGALVNDIIYVTAATNKGWQTTSSGCWQTVNTVTGGISEKTCNFGGRRKKPAMIYMDYNHLVYMFGGQRQHGSKVEDLSDWVTLDLLSSGLAMQQSAMISTSSLQRKIKF